MFKVPVALLGLLLTPAVLAQACPQPHLYDFTVYSVGNIDVQQSDYQGLTGAGGYILATNFQFNATIPGCLAVSSGGDLGIQSASINGGTETKGTAGLNSTSARGNVVAGNAHVSYSSIYGSLTTTQTPTIHSSGLTGSFAKTRALSLQVNHQVIAQELVTESARMAAIMSNSSAKIQGDDLVISLKPGNNVINLLKPEQLANAKRIVITGTANSTAMINIPGDNIILENQDVVISREILPSNITWNFFQTSFLRVSHTLNGTVGMPGRVMAPKALVEFNEALITGALYAAEIVTSLTPSYLNAGQVNRDAPVEGAPAPPPPPAAPKPY